MFYNCLDASLQTFPANSSNPQCVRYQCTEAGHATCIQRSYSELNAKTVECGRKVFPGRNLYLKALYDEHRRFFSCGEATVVNVKVK